MLRLFYLNNPEVVCWCRAFVPVTELKTDGGPIRTSFKFSRDPRLALIGKVSEPEPIKKYDDAFKMNVTYFENSVVFIQRIKVKGSTKFKLNGHLEYMAASKDKVLASENLDFSVNIIL